MYVNSHFVVTTTFLIWLYLARNHAYYFVRNMFMIAMGLALVGYVVFPTAPPRFMPEWGFADTVADFVGDSAEQSANVLYNPFAAMPSMHVAFALMIAVPAIMLVRNRVLRSCGRLPRDRHLRGRRRPPTTSGSTPRSARVVAGRLGACAASGSAPGPGPSRGLGLASTVTEEAPERTATARPRNGRERPLTAADVRGIARDRLIESRLTPNAISLTGLRAATSSPPCLDPRRATSSSPASRSSSAR